MSIDRLIKVCKEDQTRSLVDILAAAEGFKAYTAICDNLGIQPMMTHHAYNHARLDLRRKHLRSIFDSWCSAQGFIVKVVKLSELSNNPDFIMFSAHQGMPSVFFKTTPVMSSERLERLFLMFSIYWKLHGNDPS